MSGARSAIGGNRPQTLGRMNRLGRALALIGYFGLFFLLMAWTAWLSPPRVLPVGLVLILLVGPLLFPLRGLLHGRPYTHAWTSFLALFYFCAGVFNTAGNMDKPWLPWLEILFSCLLFLGAIFYVRSCAEDSKAAGGRG